MYVLNMLIMGKAVGVLGWNFGSMTTFKFVLFSSHFFPYSIYTFSLARNVSMATARCAKRQRALWRSENFIMPSFSLQRQICQAARRAARRWLRLIPLD